MSVFFIDTNCELWWEKAKELGITNIIKMPYTICDDEYYYDLGEKYNPKEFYGLVRKGNMPITSCLNAENYKEYFEPFFKKGEEILYVSFSSKMSGTFTFLDMAIKELSEKYPAAKFTRYDTKGISMGAGLSVYEAAKLHKAGKSVKEITDFLDGFILRVNAVFSPDSLQHLKKGGRLSSAQALIGGLLQIKPLIRLNDEGALYSAAKVNGRQKAIGAIAEDVIENIADADKYPIVVLDADCEDDAQKIIQKIKAALPDAEVWHQPVGPVIGTHCGPGTIAVCYVGNSRGR
ncbi:MAG: DegV family protein [Clostridia bacterium]|nr:DegV family protein [Clostridia bacterium]